MNKTARMIKIHNKHLDLKATIDRSTLLWLSKMYQLVDEAASGANVDRYKYDNERSEWHSSRIHRYDRFKVIIAKAWLKKWNEQGCKYDKSPASKDVRAFLNNINVMSAEINKYKDAVRVYKGHYYAYWQGKWNKGTILQVTSYYTHSYQYSSLRYRNLCDAVLEDYLTKTFVFEEAHSQAELDAIGTACQMAGLDKYNDIHI